MLPEPLSTDLTSLNEAQDRLAVVVDMVLEGDGALAGSELYRAHVRNHAKLAYRGVAAWLSGQGPAPGALTAGPGAGRELAPARRNRGQAGDKASGKRGVDLGKPRGEGRLRRQRDVAARAGPEESREADHRRLHDRANGVTASFLEAKGFASLRRVLKAPERWDRIRELAERFGARLPGAPDAVALDRFLDERRLAEPEKFPTCRCR
jgi:exoribonuclease-2